MRYRLLWQPLGEEEGAPVGLEAARKRLLNTSADLWTAEDRSVVGAMLQQRIAAERERGRCRRRNGRRRHACSTSSPARSTIAAGTAFASSAGRTGSWRKLSGPASSGERALGLTVPLFAAVASFYSPGQLRAWRRG